MVDHEVADPLEKELREHGVNIQKDSEILSFEGNENGEVQRVLTKKGDWE